MMNDCFACKGGECIALRPEAVCCDGCRFFKTEAQAEADRQRAYALIAAKAAEEQAYIAAAYYGGTMPWKEDGCDR